MNNESAQTAHQIATAKYLVAYAESQAAEAAHDTAWRAAQDARAVRDRARDARVAAYEAIIKGEQK